MNLQRMAYDTVFVRTKEGQMFYDIVISRKSPIYLARKWKMPVAEVKHYRFHGRKGMRSKNYIIPYFDPQKEQTQDGQKEATKRMMGGET
jgi:hypothetical protein